MGTPPPDFAKTLEVALTEDVGAGDLSVRGLKGRAKFAIEAQAEGIICGVGIAHALFPNAEIAYQDGDRVSRGDVVLHGEGQSAPILTAERTALNFLMHLSGIATFTARYVEAIAGTNARIVDTRKTVPGLRNLAKYAVRCGGGSNHRMNLSDGAMIKDNHIIAAGGIGAAIHRLRAEIPHTVRIEVECESEPQVKEAVAYGAEIILLDNMPPEKMGEIVAAYRGRALFEASGGITFENVRSVAESGVDLISVGALTHSAPALPLHLEFQPL
ncbi:MAG: nicotinate-nucleotide diphosphorylase (carboxylating) [Armatimonadota bacterium]